MKTTFDLLWKDGSREELGSCRNRIFLQDFPWPISWGLLLEGLHDWWFWRNARPEPRSTRLHVEERSPHRLESGFPGWIEAGQFDLAEVRRGRSIWRVSWHAVHLHRQVHCLGFLFSRVPGGLKKQLRTWILFFSCTGLEPKNYFFIQRSQSNSNRWWKIVL